MKKKYTVYYQDYGDYINLRANDGFGHDIHLTYLNFGTEDYNNIINNPDIEKKD